MALWDSTGSLDSSRYSHPWLAKVVLAFDERLRRRHAVYEFSSDPSCIFRLDITRAARPLALRDGTRLRAGDRIARLHFWNEHIPPMPASGPTIAWARQMQSGIAVALRELARHLASRPDLDDVLVIWAEVPSGTKSQSEQLARIMGYFGFETIFETAPLPWRERLHRLGSNILISLIVLAQNAAALRRDTLNRVRVPIYLSRRVLEAKFGDAERRVVTAEVS
jgi:hypothetical protein